MNTIDYITIDTQGDAIDFGDVTTKTMHAAVLSNSTRWVSAGGHLTNGPAYPVSNHMCYVTIPSTGNAIDFGDMTTSNARFAAESSVRAVFAGGYDHPGGNAMNNMEYNSFATKSNSVDFGDLTAARAGTQGLSTGRGGL